MADGGGYDELLLKRAIGVLAQDRHLRTVDLLARLTRRTLAARDDRVQHDLVTHRNAVDALAHRVHDAGAVRAEDRRQRSLGQAASDKHVEVVERHVAEAHPHLARAWPRLGPLAQLQRPRSLEADQFQNAHQHRVVVVRSVVLARVRRSSATAWRMSARFSPMRESI